MNSHVNFLTYFQVVELEQDLLESKEPYNLKTGGEFTYKNCVTEYRPGTTVSGTHWWTLCAVAATSRLLYYTCPTPHLSFGFLS